MSEPSRAGGGRAWQVLAAFVLTLHAASLFSTHDLVAGGDLPAHLRLMQLSEGSLAIRNVYPPAYHVIGGLLAPVVGLALVPKLLALVSVALLLAGFRSFQTAAGLPDAASEAFALLPYALSASLCAPKVEFASLGLTWFGLAALVRGRYALLAALLCASFYVHTAGTIAFGVVAGALALSRRDPAALGALFLGTLGAAPLFVAHLRAGCTPLQGLLLSYSGYLPPGGYDAVADLVCAAPVAGPLAVVAVAGGREVWRRHPTLVAPCLALALLYLGPLWMPVFGRAHGAGFYRGLSLLLLPTAVSAGAFLAARPRLRPVVLITCTAWLLLCAARFVPEACTTAPIDVASVDGIDVARCEYAWRR